MAVLAAVVALGVLNGFLNSGSAAAFTISPAPPPELPPPVCAPRDQASGNYEWSYRDTTVLARKGERQRDEHRYWISRAGNFNPFALSRAVSCVE